MIVGRKALQRCYVRFMGGVDGEFRHENHSGRKLQVTNSDGLHQLGFAGLEGFENYRCGEEGEGVAS